MHPSPNRHSQKSGITFDAFSLSNSVGPLHSENQDSYLADGENLLFAVADGVGGYKGAKQASELAVKVLAKDTSKIVDERSATSCLEDIHSKIQNKAAVLNHPNMGTTIALAKVLATDGARVLAANVGDSPILLFRGDGSCSRLYTDDSYRGSDPLSMFGIIQYLGLDMEIEVHTKITACEKGDVLLICSDGITDNLLVGERPDQSTLSQIVRRYRSAERLVQAAIERGYKPDDMTAILVFF